MSFIAVFLKPESNQGSYFMFSCYGNDNFLKMLNTEL